MSRETIEEAFRQAVEVSLREWGGVECGPRSAEWAARGPLRPGIAARLSLKTEAGAGYLALLLSPAEAAEMTARGLKGAAPPSGEWCADFLGETANVIAGQAKTLLAGTPAHFTFGTPEVFDSGRGGLMPPAGTECLWLEFDSEIGPFSLQVCMPAAGQIDS